MVPQEAFTSLPDQNRLLAEGTKLKEDSEDLKVRVDRAAGDLEAELDAARRLEDQSVQVNIESRFLQVVLSRV